MSERMALLFDDVKLFSLSRIAEWWPFLLS